MGRSGPGNLDSDAAFEHMSEVCGEILARIRRTTSSEKLMEPDEFESEALLMDIEILVALHKANLLVDPPEADEIASWKSNYLRIWDGYIGKLTSDEHFIQARRTAISATFDKLIRLNVNSN